ncbi:uncharacterized protein LOC141912666 [Tubulanus polymorphus]|uniref:uncharacterized protein LOC141912666 n=1 Tax=Tubulanus polymorphus TaxID=672921 RepID=UPI003DA42767
MWTPTHAQLRPTVIQARNLIIRGKGGTNDAYVTIQLGKEQYRTSVIERTDQPVWNEECDLPITDLSSVVQLNIYHRTFIGSDEFLGHANVPLAEFPVYKSSKNKSYLLLPKPGKRSDGRYRGEIEVKITFIVRSKNEDEDVKQRFRSPSFPSLKEMAENISDKVLQRSSSLKSRSTTSLLLPSNSNGDEIPKQVYHHDTDSVEDNPDTRKRSATLPRMFGSLLKPLKKKEDAVVFTISPNREVPSGPKHNQSLLQAMAEDKLKQRQRHKSLPESTEIPLLSEEKSVASSTNGDDGGTPLLMTLHENAQSLDIGQLTMTMGETKFVAPPLNPSCFKRTTKIPRRGYSFQGTRSSLPIVPELPADWERYQKLWEDYQREQNKKQQVLYNECLKQYEDKSHEELVKLLFNQRLQIEQKDEYVHDLEDYIDMLLVRVISTTPKILQTPYNGPGA